MSKKYKKGLHDAWDIAKKIGCYEWDGGLGEKVCKRLFPDCRGSDEVMAKYDVEEVIARINTYLSTYIIGDVVTVGTEPGIVMQEPDEDGEIMVWFKDGTFSSCTKDYAVKIGRYIDVSDLLKEAARQ